MRPTTTILLILLLTGPALADPADPAVGPVPQGLGVNIHFTDNSKPGELEMIAAAGFKWVRMDLNWGGMEKRRGEYDFSHYDGLAAALEKHGLKAQFILDYGNHLYDNGESPRTDEGREAFARWAAAVAHHFRGRGYLWEMWNEPNIFFWNPKPNVDEYAKLALAVGKAIRAAEPNETYIGPATSGVDLKFIEACFKAGCLEYWSAVSVHPYRQSGPETAAKDYRKLRTLIARYAPKGKQIPVISGEWGYSAAWQKFDEEKQGKYLARELLVNQWQQVPVSIWYDWHDDGLDPKEGEHHFGTVHNPYRKGEAEVYEPKPAYIAMKTLADQLGGYAFNKRLMLEDPDDYYLLFKKDDQIRAVAWTVAKESHEATLPASPGKFSVVSCFGEKLPLMDAGPKGLTATLTDAPLYLTPDQPNDLLRVGAAWDRLPLEVLAKAPAHPLYGMTLANPLDRSLRVDYGVGPTETINPGSVRGFMVHAILTRVPQPRTEKVTWRFEGLGELSQETWIAATNPLLVTALPLAGGAVPVRVHDPSAAGLAGRAMLIGMEGLESDQPSAALELKPGQTEAVVRIPAKAEGSDYAFGIQITDASGQVLIELPQANFGVMPDFSLGAADGKTDAWKLFADGDAKIRSEQSLAVATPLEAAPEPGMGVLRINYKCDAGWKFWRVFPTKPELKPISGEPKSFGLWIYGDASGASPRLRFVDATGQTFQPTGESITWKGWKYVTFPMQGAPVQHSHFGGANDGVIHYPIHWDSIFLLDRDAKRPAEGVVYIAGPTLVK